LDPEKFPLLSLPVHPTQLYEAGLGLILFMLGLWWLEHRRYEGQWFVFSILTYAVFRFLVEFLRADQGDTLLWFLTYAQVISIFLAVGALLVWRHLRPS
jgi:phosphatidylglycerol:prolipoprotein diacylglycerol transferase